MFFWIYTSWVHHYPKLHYNVVSVILFLCIHQRYYICLTISKSNFFIYSTKLAQPNHKATIFDELYYMYFHIYLNYLLKKHKYTIDKYKNNPQCHWRSLLKSFWCGFLGVVDVNFLFLLINWKIQDCLSDNIHFWFDVVFFFAMSIKLI